jgi:tRNA pseudouridine55 synthase
VIITPDTFRNSVILVRKERGMTSFDVISRLRRILGIKRIGHAGTLDKAAEGLLVVLTDRASRLSSYLMEGAKRYTGTVRLGITTDSCDSEGSVTETRHVDNLTEELILNAVSSFKGSILQRPPEFSAIKIAGKRSSDLARSGRPAELKERPVEIYAIETELIDMRGMTVTIAVHCSKGTYIRSLARDIGERLGCGAYLTSLVRTASGAFTLDSARTIGEIESALNAGESDRKFVYSPLEALYGMNRIVVGARGADKVLHGARFEREDVLSGIPCASGSSAIADESQNLIAIADIDVNNWSVTYRCVFN